MSDLEQRRLKLQALTEARKARQQTTAAAPSSSVTLAGVAPPAVAAAAVITTAPVTESGAAPSVVVGNAAVTIVRNVAVVNVEPRPDVLAAFVRGELKATLNQQDAPDTYDKETMTTPPIQQPAHAGAPRDVMAPPSDVPTGSPTAQRLTESFSKGDKSFAFDVLAGGGMWSLQHPKASAANRKPLSAVTFQDLLDHSNHFELLEFRMFQDVVSEAAFVLSKVVGSVRVPLPQPSDENGATKGGRSRASSVSGAPAPPLSRAQQGSTTIDSALGLGDQHDGVSAPWAGDGLLSCDGGNFFDAASNGHVVVSLAFQPIISGATSSSLSGAGPITGASSEIFAAAYSTESTASHAAHVAVWSLHRRRAPVFVLTADAPVTEVVFHPFHPNLIVGGTSAQGGVVLWDLRSGSRPVRRSFPSSDSHTAPVVNLGVMGARDNSVVVTFSADGRGCSWAGESYAIPTSVIDYSLATRKTSVLPTCAALMNAHDVTSPAYAVGTADGCIVEASSPPTATAGRYGQYRVLTHVSHPASVACLRMHPRYAGGNYGSLGLSCGVDGSLRLWTTTGASGTSVAQGATTGLCAAVETSLETISDAAWSPSHPGVFAVCDVTGTLLLFDMTTAPMAGRGSSGSDTAAPRASARLASTSADLTTVSALSAIAGGGAAASGGVPISRIAWDPSGSMLAVGSTTGAISLLSLRTDSDLVVPQHGGEWATRQLAQVVSGMDRSAGHRSA